MSTPPKAEPDWLSLLEKVLTGTVRLEGAACTGRAELFDPPGDGESAQAVGCRHHRAAAICADCPALATCDEWAQTQRPSAGVIAGQIPPPQHRGRPAAHKETA